MDVCIIGCGPAGVSAAIYLKMAGYDVTIFEGGIIGGQINTTPEIRNVAGVGDVSGWELSKIMSQQLKDNDITVMSERVIGIDAKDNPKKVITSSNVYETEIILIANGVKRRSLGCAGEERLKGKGVSYCAVCDGFFFKDKSVAVVGGGNSALEDAIYLSGICKKVFLIHRRNEFRADKVFVEQIKFNSNIEIITPATVEEICGADKVESIKIKHNESIEEFRIEGVFVSVGLVPDNEIFSGSVSLDERGYIIADEMCRTDCDGVYAAGDTREKSFRQIVTAMSDGAVASEAIIQKLSLKNR